MNSTNNEAEENYNMSLTKIFLNSIYGRQRKTHLKSEIKKLKRNRPRKEELIQVRKRTK